MSGMQMSMQMTFMGGSGGKPYMGQIMQMRMSPRMRNDLLPEDELQAFLTFSGIPATHYERNNHVTHGNGDEQSA